jgi:hypothetical protein
MLNYIRSVRTIEQVFLLQEIVKTAQSGYFSILLVVLTNNQLFENTWLGFV